MTGDRRLPVPRRGRGRRQRVQLVGGMLDSLTSLAIK